MAPGDDAMNIPSILLRYLTPAKPGHQGGAAEPPAAVLPAPGAGQAATAAAKSSDAMRDILGQYDVTDISPRAFSEMLQKLRQAGLVAEKDFQELSLIRLDLDREGTGPDERVNLLDLCRRQLERLRDELRDLRERTASVPADESLEAPLLRRLEWLQKLAAIHGNPAGVGVNALA